MPRILVRCPDKLLTRAVSVCTFVVGNEFMVLKNSVEMFVNFVTIHSKTSVLRGC